MSYPNQVFSFIAFLGFILAVVPFRGHYNAWNVGTCLCMAWIAVGCLNQFVNSVVWNGNVVNRAPVWCDISSQIIVASSTALPASSLCINRRLYYMAHLKTATVTKDQKRREVRIDLAIGIGLPIIQMILVYISQGHRFNILEDVGCYPAIYNTPVAVVFFSTPAIAIGCVTAVYSILTIRAFYLHKKRLKEVLRQLENSAGSNVTIDRYTALMLLAGIDVLFTIPLGSYWLYDNISSGVFPWISFSDTHSGFSYVGQVTASEWRAFPNGYESKLELNRLQVEICSFIFFAFFGMTKEARKNYRKTWRVVWGFVRRMSGRPYPVVDPSAPVLKEIGMRSAIRFAESRITVSLGTSDLEQGSLRPIPPARILPSIKCDPHANVALTSSFPQLPPIPLTTPLVEDDHFSKDDLIISAFPLKPSSRSSVES